MNNRGVALIAHIVEEMHEQLDLEILDTPTSPTRNCLTEANIHLIAAVSELHKAKQIQEGAAALSDAPPPPRFPWYKKL